MYGHLTARKLRLMRVRYNAWRRKVRQRKDDDTRLDFPLRGSARRKYEKIRKKELARIKGFLSLLNGIIPQYNLSKSK